MTRVAVDRDLLTEVLDYLEVASETAKHDDKDPCHELLRRLMLDSNKSLTRWGWTWRDSFGRSRSTAWGGTPPSAPGESSEPLILLSLYFFPE